MFVYTAYDGDQTVAMTVDGAPPQQPNGRLFIVPPDDPTEMPDIAGRELCRHLAYLGVVEVKLVKTKTGMEFNLEKARSESMQLLESSDLQRWMNYVNSLIEDRVSKGKTVPPPPPGVVDLMHRRGYTLAQYGIQPMGATKQKAAENSEVTTLKAEVAELKAALAELVEALGEKKSKSRAS